MDLQSEVELCAPPCFGTEALFGTLLQEISIKLPQKKKDSMTKKVLEVDMKSASKSHKPIFSAESIFTKC